jgi:5-methylcytosine-specific restriction endonuclease McrA
MTAADVQAIKQQVRERDALVCVECGMTNAEHVLKYGKSLEVHRTTPGSEYSLRRGVCVTLCRKCHAPKPRSNYGSGKRVHGARIVTLPERVAAALADLAEHQCNTLQNVVKDACVAYLMKLDRWPPKSPAG